MVEVFKTNVTNEFQAKRLAGIIQHRFDGYKVNFDLDDCDRILRIEAAEKIATDGVTNFLKGMGVRVEVLSDEVDNIESLFAGPLMIR